MFDTKGADNIYDEGFTPEGLVAAAAMAQLTFIRNRISDEGLEAGHYDRQKLDRILDCYDSLAADDQYRANVEVGEQQENLLRRTQRQIDSASNMTTTYEMQARLVEMQHEKDRVFKHLETARDRFTPKKGSAALEDDVDIEIEVPDIEE